MKNSIYNTIYRMAFYCIITQRLNNDHSKFTRGREDHSLLLIL